MEPDLPPHQGPHGSVDKCLPVLLTGWAWNPKDPDCRVTISLQDAQGKVFAQIKASKFRNDLLEAGIGDGYHAFELFPFGYGLTLNNRDIRFVIVETGALLELTPDARTPPSRIPEPIYSLSTRFPAPLPSENLPVNEFEQNLKSLALSLDSLYKVIENDHPDVALSLNNSPQRVLTFIPDQMEVLFVIGLRDGESKRYRVYNVAEALRMVGYRCGIYFEDDIESIIQRRPNFLACVVFRAPFTPIYQALIDYARSISAKTIWDVDDYVFDVRIIPQIDGLRYLAQHDKIKNAEGMRLYRKFITSVDAATTTTPYLAERLFEAKQEAFVIPNTLNSDQLEFYRATRDDDARNPDVINIAFFSGTKTHDLDFREARLALLQTLTKYENTRFIVVGHFDIDQDPDFLEFGGRVEKISFVPYIKMLDLLRYIDIIIVPLEMIPYCHGKSELKFFEAALVGCVTIASATDTYARAIENGVSGFACKTYDDWVEAFDLLCGSKALRDVMAHKARNVALQTYTMARYVGRIAEAYGLPQVSNTIADEILDRVSASHDISAGQVFKRAPKKQGNKRGAFLLPDLLIGGGGHRKAIMFASALEQAEIPVDLIFQNSTRTPEELGDIINGSYSPFLGDIRLYTGSLTNYGWVVATSWSTAVSIIERGYPTSRALYLVQDFEPLFYPMGSDYIRAEASYLSGFKVVTYGNWIGSHLKRHFNLSSLPLPFSIDRTTYKIADVPRRNRLLCFAKPEMSRRCFEISREALRIFSKLCPDVEICFFGSNSTKGMKLGFDYTDFGVVTNLDFLSAMYCQAQAGIAISTTNPSVLGYEMLACGCPVIDLDRPDMAENYGSRGPGLVPVRPFAHDFAHELAALMGDPQRLKREQVAAPKIVEGMPSDSEVCAMFVDYVRDFLSELSYND